MQNNSERNEGNPTNFREQLYSEDINIAAQIKSMLKIAWINLVYVLFPYTWWYRSKRIQTIRTKCFELFLYELEQNESLLAIIKNNGFIASKKNRSLNAVFALPKDLIAATAPEERSALIHMTIHEKLQPLQNSIATAKALDLIMVDSKPLKDNLMLVSLMPPYRREIEWSNYMRKRYLLWSSIAVVAQALLLIWLTYTSIF